MLVLTVLMGLPGSGKSFYCQEATRSGAVVVSADAIRLRQVAPVAVFAKMRRDITSLLAAQRCVIVDTCNLLPQHRSQWLRLGREAGARCDLVIVDAGVDVAAARNRLRDRSVRVDEASWKRMARMWPVALRAVQREQWDRVEVVSSVDSVLRSRAW